MIIGGVDGCKAGWILVYYNDEGKLDYAVADRIELLTRVSPNINKVRFLIDIPIGLSGGKFVRTVEVRMREILEGRSSTVFSAPARAAVYTENYENANELNKKILGKGLSKQSFFIGKKIRQIDEFLKTNNNDEVELLESHPEICFRYLAGGVLLSKKKNEDGREERLNLLEKRDKNARHFFEKVVKATSRAAVSRDDIIDALCLCIVNKMSIKKGFEQLSDENDKDEEGINVGIAYY